MKIFIVFLFALVSFGDARSFVDDAPPTALVGVNITWTFTSGVNLTNVTIVVKRLGAGEWAAAGLGQEVAMVKPIE